MTDASFVLRVDAGAQVGFGHAGRCLALWEQLRDRCVVAVADDAAAEVVRGWGARVADGDAQGDVTVVDRAPVAPVDEVEGLKAAGAKVCLVDDAGPARELADAVVDPPTGPDWPKAAGTRLGGFEHALLREEIRAAAGDRLREVGVLVSMGGSDPTGLTVPLCTALDAAGVETMAVLGPGYEGPPPPGRVLDDPELWPRALAGAELLVCGFGHTLLEAAHLGVPAVAIPRHERDAREAAVFAAHGTMAMATPDDAVATVSALRGSDRLREMRRTGPALVDGRGAERVAAALEALR
jgi:spore coat polysaccharide biosynthesis predicted glycosyltransferase SpsG